MSKKKKKNGKRRKAQKTVSPAPALAEVPKTMSRQEDLTYIEKKILSISAEAKRVQQTYQQYHAEVQASVRDILTEAGVWEEVHSMEIERTEASKRADTKIRELQAEAGRLQAVRNFLLGREAETPEQDEGAVAEPDLDESEETPEKIDEPVPEPEPESESESVEPPEEEEDEEEASPPPRPSPPEF